MQRRQASSQGFRGSDVGSDDSVELMGRRLPLKWASLVLLIAQNTCLVLAMRYSRTQVGPMYLASTAVVCAEVVKMVISVVCLAREMGPKWSTYVIEELFSRDTLLLALPGLLYTVQNNLLFIALSNLQAAVYQVTYQLKILTTALMTSLLLGRRLNRNQIISLGMLTLGVALVQLAGTTSKQNENDERRQYPALGLFCVLAACLTSGFAGVYTEKVIKHGRSVPLFMRNIQLSSFGIILGLCGVVLSDFHAVYEHGFFQGYNKLVWFVILLQAGGGLMIAVVMKYADNILKGFATSISIVLSSYLSMLFFNFRFTFGFAVGSSVVIAAVFLYSKPMASIVDSKPSNV